jgi:hypothetical protein
MMFYLTTSFVSVASAAGQIANVATNPSSIASIATPSTFTRPFEQQNWIANKENLVYAMCNQLSQFDETDEKFAEFCIKILINQPFSFQKM